MDDEIPESTPEERIERENEEFRRQLTTTVRYIMRQGFTETQVRRVMEQVLNEARSG